MKVETVTIQVQRYTDDNGKLTCEGCLWGDGKDLCDLVEEYNWYIPGPNCPIWNNAVKPKWATFDDWFLHEYKGCLKKELLIGAWEAARENE